MAPPTVRIRLLGELDLRLGEGAVPPLGSARAESLLAYLLLHREAAQPCQRLAFLLWPDSSEPQARTNLRHLLHVLRRALPDLDRLLEVTPRTLRWREDAPCWLDVAAFEDALARAERAGQAGQADRQLAALRQAAELYRGDLLESSYDEWLLEERERLRRRHLEALERLVELLEARAPACRGDRLRRAGPARGPPAGGDLPGPDAAPRRPRRPGQGAAGLPRLRRGPGTRAARRALGGDPPGLRGAAPRPRPAGGAAAARADRAARPAAPGRARVPAGPPDRPVAGRRGRRRPAGAGDR